MRIGIDLGGSKIEILALNDEGVECYRKRVPTPRHDYDATLRAIKGLVDDCLNTTRASSAIPGITIGLGHPGAISPATGVIKNANSTWLNGRALEEDLRRVLVHPLRLANDANCFALSEAAEVGAEARVLFGVILGTGTGGGIVVDSRILVGPNAIAGEWGHNPLPWPQSDEWPGPPCYCGRTGCIESFLSGPGFERDFSDSLLATKAAAAEKTAAAEIVSRAEAGDPLAAAALQRYCERLARALSSVINMLDPDVIVLGGGMSNIRSLYLEVPRLWGRWVFSDRVDTKLIRAAHGDSSGVRGAAWLWPESR